MAKLGLSSPWVVYYRKVEAMFKQDSEVRVIFDEERKELSLFVADEKKANALMKLLPEEVDFGNVTLKVIVVPPNTDKVDSVESDIVDAFVGNPALSYVQRVDGIFSNPIIYVVFEKEVVQYFTDNLSDIHGIESTLYQNIAKDIFNHVDNVYYCTDIEEYDLAMPLGEWP